jgi:hypothetical protein
MTIASTTFTEHQLFAINSNMEEVWKIKKAPMSESRAMIIESDYYIGCEAKQEITAQFDESHTEVDRRTFWQKFLPEFSTTVASLVHR